MHNYKDFLNAIKCLNCFVLKDEPMKKYTSFKIGGPADYLLKVNSKETLVDIIKSLNQFNIPFFVLGNGSNLLINDKGIRGVVLKLEGDFKTISLSTRKVITCGSAVLLSQLAAFAKLHNLTGLEFLWGIPGSVGGAVYMNAGAYGKEIKDVIYSANHVTLSGKKAELKANEMDLSYRHSIYSQTKDIITSASFNLKEGNPVHIQENMDTLMQKRKDKQPLEFPNAGSVFKRPIQNFAGALIEGCALKGKRIGGAMVSDKHSGFIVNIENATCFDVLDLIELVRTVVLEKTGVLLETEIKVIPENI